MARRVKQRRLDWSRRLSEPLCIPGVMSVETLGDLCLLIERHLPKAYQERPHWRAVARDLEAAAAGGDIEEVVMSLRFAFLVEGIACRPAG
jgi:hypothetical protein